MQTVSLYQPIQKGLARVEDKLKSSSDLNFPFLAKILDHVFETRGKKVRPAITLLSSNFHPHDNHSVETMATAVEMLHIATLIHDDTVDNSDIRRGRATISSLWGRNTAVLVGDYVFAASATLVCDIGNVRIIKRFAQTIMELSTGELQETAEASNCHHTMEQYLDRIYNKTASLFTTAAESGAIISDASEVEVEALKNYGYNLGMAFQIVDDILDFEATEEEVGKPVGNDLYRGIMTLPSIIAMDHYPKGNPIPRLFQSPHDKTLLKHAIDMVQNSSIIDDSYAIAQDFCDKALQNLRVLPKNQSRDSLNELVSYILTRRK